MENKATKNDLLTMNSGVRVSPKVTFIKEDNTKTIVPDLHALQNNGGFSVSIEVVVHYEPLTKIIRSYLVNKRFEVSEGFIDKHVIVKNCQVYGGESDNLIISVDFTGSHNGTVYFTGKPVCNGALKKLELQNFDYDLKTNDFLLKAVKWLFDKRISTEIKNRTVIDLSTYYVTAGNAINSWLNKEWTKGISGSGSVTDMQITSVHAQQQHLLLRMTCTGNIGITVQESGLTF